MDDKSLQLLEFPQIRENLASHTSFLPSRELALKLEPLTNYDQISLLLKQSAEGRHLLTIEPNFSIGGIYDIREIVKLASLGKILESQNLLDVQYTLATFSYLRNRLARLDKDFPLLWNFAKDIIELSELEHDLSVCFTPDGEIRDDASPKLSNVRQQLKSVRAELLIHLQSIISSSRWQKAIQEPIITEREGRYVIPVKVEAKSEVRGIIHDLSNTGATIFVEPWVTIDAGNSLRALEIEERHEIERILLSLSNRIGTHASDILQNIRLIAELDLILAKAKYARKINAFEPTVIAPDENGVRKATLKLIEARHPLLPLKAVPLSVEIGNDFSILVITGPNTGGKTVALKTIGLLSLMVQTGLPIPAAPESTLPIFDNVFADIGDEQSIAQTLSTFSWHITNLVRIVKQVTSNSLVLLDELGTSTDPAEGSALARSLLMYFSNHRTMVIATTHFSDLKAFAHKTPGLQNASLDFDPVTLSPTYHLTVGIPGGSNALATALRFGLPEEIITSARNMLSHGSQELESLLSDLVNEKQKVQSLSTYIEREKVVLEKKNSELENELSKIKSEERRIISEIRDNIMRESADLFKDIRQASAELRKEKSKGKIEEAKRILSSVQNKLKSETFTMPPGEVNEEDKINEGDTVWFNEGNIIGTVLSISYDIRQVDLQVGQARLRVGLDNITKATRSKSPQTLTTEPMVLTATEKRKVPMELDLRGKRAEEINELVDGYLDDAAVANLGRVRIIHGHGTGVVRQIVREILSSHPLIKSYRPGERGEGGDGVTVANLK
jgi:DNA mismatch repair protein MutS2